MRRILLGVFVLTIAGCECLFLEPDPGNTGGGSGGNGGGGEANEHPECVGVNEPFTFAEVAAASAQPKISDGVQELKVTPMGCVVVRRVMSGGSVVEQSLQRYLGYSTIIDGGLFNPVIGPVIVRFVDVTATPDAVRAAFDPDGDLKIDYRIAEDWAQGSLVKRESTWLNDTTGAVTQRTTLSAAAGANMRWKVEVLVMGTLTTVYDGDVPSAQRQNLSCYMPAPGADDTVTCPISDADIRKKLHDALAEFSLCLQNLGAEGVLDRHQLELWVLDSFYLDKMTIECFQANDYFGEMRLKTNVLRLNVGMLGMCETPKFTTSTIVHELMHRLRGPHEFENPSGPYGPRAEAYSDPARACEELCFGTLKTKCSCARCLGVKACDPKCSSLRGCKETDDAGMVVSSEAVGARCPANNTWFPTMMACDATGACPRDGNNKSQCKSYSVSCDPNCQ